MSVKIERGIEYGQNDELKFRNSCLRSQQETVVTVTNFLYISSKRVGKLLCTSLNGVDHLIPIFVSFWKLEDVDNSEVFTFTLDLYASFTYIVISASIFGTFKICHYLYERLFRV
jgi:hypothetical protein